MSDREGVRKLMESSELKGGVKAVMQSMVELFSAQMFSWGWIHCDPHPGNVIIRANPSNPKKPQLVLLDHGLYVRVQEKFRTEWSTLWQGLLTADFEAVQNTTTKWGLGVPDLFASATLMRPVRLQRRDKEKMKKIEREHDEFRKMSQYEQSVKMKQKLRDFLVDTDRMPQELLFILRNMRCV